MGLEFLLRADFLLDLFQLPVHEFDDIPALEADQMVVPRPPESLLEAGVILAEAVAGDQAAVYEQVEGIVHGGAGDIASSRVDRCEESVRIEVAVGAHDLVQ